ncbi:hypothetical protein N657DRAFT_638442 [Parathielavia appendiculata]|uniref:Uncharacterized protein n=1 Tax=Parathielavia appendiculata TaxID=2587402 RepID=A0AAN6U8E3_9PEZI|nr:hypothetical protein N657DRAFT_638442 [Parathielavia appendiculata]
MGDGFNIRINMPTTLTWSLGSRIPLSPPMCQDAFLILQTPPPIPCTVCCLV